MCVCVLVPVHLCIRVGALFELARKTSLHILQSCSGVTPNLLHKLHNSPCLQQMKLIAQFTSQCVCIHYTCMHFQYQAQTVHRKLAHCAHSRHFNHMVHMYCVSHFTHGILSLISHKCIHLSLWHAIGKNGS